VSITRSFWLAVHRDVAGQPRVRAFIDWLLELVKSGATTLQQ
jgi:DNA-binding transcriptional LysR family regulator